MVGLQRSLLLISLTKVAVSKPAIRDTDDLDRYNPVRRLMDALCTGFETSFCVDDTSPAAINHILPEISSDNARTVPPLCEPSNFKDYRNFVDNRPFQSNSESSKTKQDCCITCYEAGNCLSWTYNPDSLQCNYFTATSNAEDGAESEVCPLGVTKGSYEEMPGYPVLTGDKTGHNYGPCTWDAPLGNQRAIVRGKASESSKGGASLELEDSSLQQEVLEL